MRLRLGCLLISLAAASLLAPAPALTQSAEQILSTALTQHEARMRGIENYTLVQEVMGIETTVYFEREMVDGRPMYRSRVVSAGGQGVPVGGGWESPYEGFAEFASRARYQGTETVDGHRTHALVVEDFRGLPGAPMPEDAQDFDIRQATLYLDASNHVLRRMVMEGTATVEGRARPITMQARFEDYREVDGLLHPFRTVMTTAGLAAPDVSAADMAEARRSLAQLERQMEGMPAAQREMMERMIRPQMKQLENLLAGEGLEFAIEVREVRVNAGPPAAR
jgi:hypothetical protein